MKNQYSVISLKTGDKILTMSEYDMDLYCNRHNLLDALTALIDMAESEVNNMEAHVDNDESEQAADEASQKVAIARKLLTELGRA